MATLHRDHAAAAGDPGAGKEPVHIPLYAGIGTTVVGSVLQVTGCQS